MATDKSQNIDAFGRQELGWVVPEVLDSHPHRVRHHRLQAGHGRDHAGRTATGTPYTLTEGQDGVGRVQNSQMYVAKLPGRVAARPGEVRQRRQASSLAHLVVALRQRLRLRDRRRRAQLRPRHPGAGVASRRARRSRSTSSPCGTSSGTSTTATCSPRRTEARTYASHPSENGYTTSNTDPLAGNPNQNGCQATYDNGITGTSAGPTPRAPSRRTASSATTPTSVFLADSYDISDLVGSEAPVPALQLCHRPRPGPAGLVHRRRGGHRDAAERLDAPDLRTRTSRPAAATTTRGSSTAVAGDLTDRGTSAARAGSTSPPAPRDPRTTPTTSRCATARASTSTATARSTGTRSAFESGLYTRLHRRGARLRQRRHRRPAGPVAAGQPAGARRPTPRT